MERTILFKAKKLSDGTWVKGSLVKSPLGTQIVRWEDSIEYIDYVDPSTVCQFTGLEDKDDKPIWEHDIISIFEGRKPCEVIFKKGCFIAYCPTTGIHIPISRGIDYYDWELHVVCNKFGRKEGEK